MRNKNCVIVWLYNIELADEFISYLYPIRNYVDIYLGLCEDNHKQHFDIIKEFHNLSDNIKISTFRNCGADIRPFLKILPEIADYDNCFKIHTKMSNWGARRHCPWRQMLIEDLIGSEDIFKRNLQLLTYKKTGMIGCQSFIFDKVEFLHTPIIRNIMDTLDEPYHYDNVDCKKFIAGTMFAFKPAHMLKVLNQKMLDVLCLTLEQERGKVSEKHATYSHSLERIFGYIYSKDKLLSSCSRSNTVPLFSKNIQPYSLNLRILNDNSCYVQENCQIFGKVLVNTPKEITISWSHTPKTELAVKTYQKKDNAIIG